MDAYSQSDTDRQSSVLNAPAKAPDYSVIIEWENVALAGSSRASEMLRRLAKQTRDMHDKCVEGEVILVCDAGDQSNQSLPRLIHDTFQSTADKVHIISVRNKRYYDKKNAGAMVAGGSILVFLDSDVVPEDQWLERLLGSFLKTDVSVVAGATYLEQTTIYARAVAAFWFFPPRCSEEGLVPADAIFDNNIAFRRQVFLDHPYPSLSQFRGQQGPLVGNLRKRGLQILLQRGARCAHPPPNGLGHFIRRAVCEGYDNIIVGCRTSGVSRLPWRHTYWSICASLRSSLQNICERRAMLNLTVVDVLLAVAIAMCYTSFIVLGELMTRVNPGMVTRRFSI